MCDMHRQATEGKFAAEQRRALEEHVRSMHGTVPQDMVDHPMKMMETCCAPHARGAPPSR